MAASCRIYKFKEDRRQIVVSRNICKQLLFNTYKASGENVVVRRGGGEVCEIVRTSRKIPATPLMANRKIMNGYRPNPHQSCNRPNIVRNFYCLLMTTELAQGSKKDTAVNRVQGDDFTHGVFNNYYTCHTTWITSTFINCTDTKSLH